MNNLKHIEINIGKACNNKCIFCMSGRVRFDPKSKYKNLVAGKDVLEEIEYYAEEGYQSIGFLGGDISIHPNILEIISHSKNLGFKEINIISNGMLFDNKEFLRNIIEAGVTRINFSIHSHLHEIEDFLTKIPGGLKRKLVAIDNCNDFINTGLLKSMLSINIVLNKKNYSTAVETCLFYFFKKGVRDIRINFVEPDFGMEEFFEDFVVRYEDILEELKKLIYISLKYNIRITFDTIPPCIFKKVFPKNYKNIVTKFSGEPKDHIHDVSDLSSGRRFNWQEKKENTLKFKSEDCKKCLYDNHCQGIWREYNKMFGCKEISPIIS